MSQNIKRSASYRIARMFDLPETAVAAVPEITITGRNTVTVDDHKGLLVYDETVISVMCSGYKVSIYGYMLELSAMDADRIEVTGEIDGIKLEGAVGQDN